MKLDQAGRDFIKGFESLRLKVYLDEAGIWTIGWGHTDGVTERSADITEGQAELLFGEDLQPCEQIVSRFVCLPLTQNQFNALVSFSFNAGCAPFHHSTLLKKLNAGDFRGASKEFGRWVHYTDPNTHDLLVSNGLADRRAKEEALFMRDFRPSLA